MKKWLLVFMLLMSMSSIRVFADDRTGLMSIKTRSID